MGTERGAEGRADLPYDPKQLSSRQRALLFFNTTRRKFWAGFVLVAVWFLLLVLLEDKPYLEQIPILFLYAGIGLLWGLFSHGSGRYKPVAMPAPVMQPDARRRFMNEESWESPLPPANAMDALTGLFGQPEVEAEVMDHSIWVQLGKNWQAAEWWHGAAAPHIKRRPALQFFVYPSAGGSTITAYSSDRTLGGVYDVLKLSDEMSATAVELARKATEKPSPV
ncbi:hypothetical protein [Arthrobacter sp. ISL-72]|uniref:hypothetical protein n=1 Tax=Arthrobacter sp. ISL-72 TaxID=2819114 RepID=UPI001BE53489|nr:hypothetical protein [Arthrobacter sp. ISL-72]MBT2594655.1 hypothetical protein [Arthrobacter sp. ISL-72]